MTLDFTLLAEEQIWGDDALEVMKSYGTRVAPTNLAVLLGVRMSASDYERTADGNLACESLTKSTSQNRYFGDSTTLSVGTDGSYTRGFCDRLNGIRPVLPASEAQKMTTAITKKRMGSIEVVEYGEYPQTVADEQTSQELESLFSSSSLKRTGKNYTFDANDPRDEVTDFCPQKYDEFEYQGKKYIRILGNPASKASRLSIGKSVRKWEPYWVQTEPIEWLKDPSGILISKKALFAGVPFNMDKYYDGDFSKTFMKHYLDTYFAKEMEPSENTADKERAATLKGLKARLAEVSDLDKVRATIKPARTPERTEELAEIMRLRRAGEFLRPILQKAEMERDEETLNAVIDMAKPFEKPWVEMRQRVADRRMARHAKKDRE